MSVLVEWNTDDSSILHVDMVAPWDWNEFAEGVRRGQQLLSHHPNPTGILVDVRDAGALPPPGFLRHSANALRILQALPMAFISNSQVMTIIFRPLVYWHPHRDFFFVYSCEQALRKLQEAATSSIPT